MVWMCIKEYCFDCWALFCFWVIFTWRIQCFWHCSVIFFFRKIRNTDSKNYVRLAEFRSVSFSWFLWWKVVWKHSSWFECFICFLLTCLYFSYHSSFFDYCYFCWGSRDFSYWVKLEMNFWTWSCSMKNSSNF